MVRYILCLLLLCICFAGFMFLLLKGIFTIVFSCLEWKWCRESWLRFTKSDYMY